MSAEFKTSKPIYSQIADRIIQQFVRGELHPGEKLPSVREMAIQSSVNPNTIQRTYSELERLGVVEMKRGQGTFMTEQSEMKRKLRADIQKEMIEVFIGNMRSLGLDDHEIYDSINQFLKEGDES